MITYMVALLCVLGLAVGQILFKASAVALTASSSIFSPKAATILLPALCLYAISSVAWVWVLQKIDLGRVYPLMALAFILVPLGSHIFFGEKFSPQYFLGVSLIVLGVIVVTKA